VFDLSLAAFGSLVAVGLLVLWRSRQ
jgi:hypothetical protein